MWGSDVEQSVINAGKQAIDKHGQLPSDPLRACAILGREWGEAINEALHATLYTLPPWYPDVPDVSSVLEPMKMEASRRLYAELAQVAATAMLMMEDIKCRNRS